MNEWYDVDELWARDNFSSPDDSNQELVTMLVCSARV